MEAVLKSQEQLQALFVQKMDTFEAALQQNPSDKTSSLAQEFHSFREHILLAVKSLQAQITLLARDTDNIEMRSRRKILLFHGVPEEKGEDTAACAVRVVCEKLKLLNFQTSDISRCHRLGRSATSDRPRPILIKLSSMLLRQKLWYAKTSLKSSGITMSEYLTKPRHELFMAARERFGVTKCWTRDGFVIVLGLNNTRHRLSTRSDLDNIEVPVSSPAPSSMNKKTVAVAGKKVMPTKRRVAMKQ